MKTTKDRELIIWDGNRLSMPTQRQFHAAVQEVRGHRVMKVPAAAREMVPLMQPEAPDRGRGAIARTVNERKRQGKGRTGVDNVLNAVVQLWWLDEWARPDGLYGIRELTDHEQHRYEQFMGHIPGAGFTGAGNDRDVLRALPDAQIVCETLAIDGHLLLTDDPNTIEPEKLLPWTRRLAEAGWISQPHVVEEAHPATRTSSGVPARTLARTHDQSAADFALACKLVEAGHDDEHVANAVEAARRRLGDAKADRVDYIDRTVAAARRRVERQA